MYTQVNQNIFPEASRFSELTALLIRALIFRSSSYLSSWGSIKAIPHNSERFIAQSDFSSDSTKKAQAGWRLSRLFGAIWRNRCKQDSNQGVSRELCGVALNIKPSGFDIKLPDFSLYGGRIFGYNEIWIKIGIYDILRMWQHGKKGWNRRRA